jgi:hypothetical protein
LFVNRLSHTHLRKKKMTTSLYTKGFSLPFSKSHHTYATASSHETYVSASHARSIQTANQERSTNGNRAISNASAAASKGIVSSEIIALREKYEKLVATLNARINQLGAEIENLAKIDQGKIIALLLSLIDDNKEVLNQGLRGLPSYNQEDLSQAVAIFTKVLTIVLQVVSPEIGMLLSGIISILNAVVGTQKGAIGPGTLPPPYDGLDVNSVADVDEDEDLTSVSSSSKDPQKKKIGFFDSLALKKLKKKEEKAIKAAALKSVEAEKAERKAEEVEKKKKEKETEIAKKQEKRLSKQPSTKSGESTPDANRSLSPELNVAVDTPLDTNATLESEPVANAVH